MNPNQLQNETNEASVGIATNGQQGQPFVAPGLPSVRSLLEPRRPELYVRPGGPCCGSLSLEIACKIIGNVGAGFCFLRLFWNIYLFTLLHEDYELHYVYPVVYGILIATTGIKIIPYGMISLPKGKSRTGFRTVCIIFIVYNSLDLIVHVLGSIFVFMRGEEIAICYLGVVPFEIYFMVVVGFRYMELAPDGPQGPEVYPMPRNPLLLPQFNRFIPGLQPVAFGPDGTMVTMTPQVPGGASSTDSQSFIATAGTAATSHHN